VITAGGEVNPAIHARGSWHITIAVLARGSRHASIETVNPKLVTFREEHAKQGGFGDGFPAIDSGGAGQQLYVPLPIVIEDLVSFPVSAQAQDHVVHVGDRGARIPPAAGWLGYVYS